jgi:hypothetical protein
MVLSFLPWPLDLSVKSFAEIKKKIHGEVGILLGEVNCD